MAQAHLVHLIDASPYIFRAYFSIPSSIKTPSGRPANAVYGFTNFLLKYIAEEQPTHLGIAFDESLNTSFRNDIYPAYKAQRDLPPKELEAQLTNCQRVASALGAATFVDDRYEADDLIAALTAQLVKKQQRVCVVTSDKDLAQLVDDDVELFDYARGERYDSAAVHTKFGVQPTQIADFLGLAGDSVDNIPGVKGVGAKTAVALLAAFGSLDALYADLQRVAELDLRGASKLAPKLAAERDMALLSRELATVARDAPALANLNTLKLRGADPELIDTLFDELGFGRIRARIVRWM